MKLCFSTLGCPEWTWGEIVTAAHELGFDGVEVRGVHKEIYAPAVPDFQPGKLNATHAELNRLGLTIPCLTTACNLNDREQHAAMIAEGKVYIALAQALGVPYIRILPDLTAHPEAEVDEELVRAGALELAQAAKGAGVTLLLETNGYYADSNRLLRLIQAVDRPEIAVLWDIHHPYRYFGEAPETTYRRLAPYIRHVHVKDSRMVAGKAKYCMLGTGDIPVAACVKLLEQGNYRGYYSLEWLRRFDLSLEEAGVVFAQYVSKMRTYG
ncbi:MAG: sugar phosphate isomerase/epimerase family protein [Christensenellales bacterium]|jgi:sugar phosphate isomerase/epimerase